MANHSEVKRYYVKYNQGNVILLVLRTSNILSFTEKFFPMKYSIFKAEQILCIMHEHVFVM